ncbi:MAG: hypothetical protein PHQ53_09125, partial [Candidatus Krumholzibacteria bacterium]|nr:hypothetical protein [Candidatus Krumholzibacteria bacterium]
GLRLDRSRSDRDARRMFLVSLVYLPAALLLMVADRGPGGPQDAWLLQAPQPVVGAVAGDLPPPMPLEARP